MVKNSNSKHFSYNVQLWMITELGITMSAAIVYALIYSVSSTGKPYMDGIDELCAMSNSSKSTIQRAIHDMIKKEIIIPVEEKKNGETVTGYIHNEEILKSKGII